MDTNVDEVKKFADQPQCQYYVARKKRLCRMTVRAGRNYCGEHEPQPTTENGNDDKRVPCPNDPKHTCYASKLSKHLAICNARQMEAPSYIVPNINAPPASSALPRTLLSQVPQQKIMALIEKINILYDKYVKDTITTMDDKPIHEAVLAEFKEEGRAESSLRHLRQVSSLLHAAEAEGFVKDGTCYVELGAGKGHLSYYAYSAWCGAGASASRVLLVDRASLRHKRDNKLRPAGGEEGEGGDGRVRRVRADLAHLALHKVPEVASCGSVVGLAKHLCGAATDFALRCMTGAAGGAGGEGRAGGLVLATCCHHRCDPASYVGAPHLKEMGITDEELSIMLGVVSWATCGDGLSRERRAQGAKRTRRDGDTGPTESVREERAAAGRRAKALLDEGRARYLRRCGHRARLAHYVAPHVSLENVALVATLAATLATYDTTEPQQQQ